MQNNVPQSGIALWALQKCLERGTARSKAKIRYAQGKRKDNRETPRKTK
jgi:hypothetical protein